MLHNYLTCIQILPNVHLSQAPPQKTVQTPAWQPLLSFLVCVCEQWQFAANNFVKGTVHTEREFITGLIQARTASPNQLLSGGGRCSIVTSSSLGMEKVDSGGRG